jgi:uncharacterized protein involved in outer membrane biogenesis
MPWKWIFIGVGGLILALVVVAYVVVANYDFNALKPRLAQAVKEHTGRELVLGGDVDVKLGLIPAFVVENVSLQNAAWGSRPELARVKRLEMQVALLPLLRREVALQRLLIVEPDILIETDKSGRSNLDFATREQGTPAASQPAPPPGDATIPALLVQQVRIEQGRLTYKDGQTGKTQVVDLQRLRAEGSGPGEPIAFTLQGAYNAQSFEAQGTLGSLAALSGPGASWPLTVRAKAAGATVTVDGTVQDVLHARGLTVTITAQGFSLPAVAQLAEVQHVPEVGPFTVSFTVTDPGGTLAVEQLKVEAGSADLTRLVLSGAIKDVRARRGIEAQFTVQGQDLGSLQKWFGTSLPIQGPVTISGRVSDIGPQAYQVADLQAVLPNLDLSGTATVNLAGAQPQLTAQLFSEKLDLRPFLSHTQEQTTQQPEATRPATKKDKVFPQEPLPLGGLQLVDATLDLRARQLLTPRLALDDLMVHLVLQGGHLTVSPVQARIGGGSLDGNVKLQPAGQAAQVALVVNMNQVDISRMAKELQVKDILDGELDVAVEVRGRGDSVATIMAGLQGKTALEVGKGKLDNQYIELLGADLGVSLFRLINPFKSEQQGTDINCLVSRFDIQDGIARSAALVFDTPNMSVVGDGQINLKTEALDFSLKPSPKEGASVSELGRIGLNLSELARPFKLGGTLAHPSLAVDATQAALTVGKSLGGAVLSGPAGIVAALGSGSDAEGENPCVKALEAAKTGAKPTSRAREDVKETLEKATEGIGTGLKKLFGR